MKIPSWLKYGLIGLASFLICIFLVWHLSPVKSLIRRKLVKHIQKSIPASILLQNFSLGWHSITFQQIEIRPPQHRYRILLEGVRLEWNWLELFKNHSQPLQAVHKIVLQDPRIIFQTNHHQEKTSTVSAGEFNRFLLAVQHLPQVQQIQIRSGAIFWQTGNSHPIPILTRLNGYLYYINPNNIQLEAQARLASDAQPSIQMLAFIDLTMPLLNGQFTFHNCRLEKNLPFLQKKYYRLQRAVLNGVFHFSMPHLQLDSLALKGRLVLTDAQGTIFNQTVQAPRIELTLDRQLITIEPFEGTLEGARASFTGTVSPILHPQVDWHLEVWDYPANRLRKSHSVFDLVEEGKISGQARFTGPFRHMKITARLKSPRILYAIVPFHHDEIRLTYQNKVLTLNQFQAYFRKLQNRGSGVIDFRSDQLRLTVQSTLKIPTGTLQYLDRLNASTLKVLTHLKGNFLQKDFRGSWQYALQDSQRFLLQGKGPVHLRNQSLWLSARSLLPEDSLKLQGHITQLFSNPFVQILDVQNLPLEKLTSNIILKNLASDYLTHLYFSGPYNFLAVKFKWSNRQDGKLMFAFQGNLKNIFKEHQRFFGRFQANTSPLPLRGNLSLNIAQGGLKATIHVPQLLDGNIFLGEKPTDPFQGELKLQKFQIADYISNTTNLSRLIQEGNLQGAILFGGTVAHPDIRFQLQADAFIINKVGYYATQIRGHLENHRWISEDFTIYLNNAPICIANGYWDVHNDSLQLDIHGKDIESNFLAETIFHDPTVMRGTFSYDFHVRGTLKRPVLFGNIDVRNGKLLNNPFDLISLSFLDSLRSGGNLWENADHLFQVEKFLYVNREEYTIEGKGILGFAHNSPVDVQLKVTGNILTELPKIQPFFQNPQSNGYLTMHITGSREHPVLQEAQLKITSGSLEFASVIPPLRNLTADISLSSESNKVYIREISGTLNRRWVKISNTFHPVVHGKNLKPLYLEELGLNFGVLVLETDKKGIPLSIPGLMMKGDIGYFAASGKTEGEKFYFAGPITAPVVRGKITLFHCRVTFPFLETGASEESSKVVEFLRNINWDVLTVPGNANRYFVDIPAYVGRVYLDLNIDNSSPGLEFTGRLADETFRVAGSVESSRGRVEYLDINFRVDKFGAEFHHFDLYPTIYGKAYTTVRDSANAFPRDIYLELYAIDPETGQEVNKGSWENFRFKLVSSDPVVGETQEQVLAYLGYSISNIKKKASRVGLTMTENFIIRPLVRPLERRLERGLGLDYVRFKSNFTTNLFYLSLGAQSKFFQGSQPLRPQLAQRMDPMLLLLQSSEITLGKYLARNLYLSYSGQLVSLFDEAKIGFNHRFDMEYRLMKNLLLEIEYDRYQFNPIYYNRSALRDLRIRWRYSFNF